MYRNTPFRPRTFESIALCLHTPPILTFWEKVSLFRFDLICDFVFLPLAFCVLTAWLSYRWRIIISIFASCFITGIVTIETLAYLTSHIFPSLLMVWFAVLWTLESHDVWFNDHPWQTLLYFVAALVFIALVSIGARVALRRNTRWLNHAVLAAFGLAFTASAVAYIPRVQTLPWSQSMLRMTVFPALLENQEYFTLHSRSIQELMQIYREQAQAPAPVPSAYTGKAKDYNVLLFVMESMTAQAFDPARDSLNDMPNVRRLRDQSFLLGRHYTSYPLTPDALFSIFTSFYARQERNITKRVVKFPGLIYTLRNTGYKTAYYGFTWNGQMHNDRQLVESIGFEKIASQSPSKEEITAFSGPPEYINSIDIHALHELREDIRGWTSQQQKFAAVFFPEIGHDPYRELNGHRFNTPLERGHALAVYQDAWLGELIDELQRDGALSNTIIVITGDHGMRFYKGPGGEIHQVNTGMLQDLVMRVPMIIYVPGILKHSVLIDTPTSHIDITPTLFDLLGIQADSELEQGSSVFNPELDKRRLFIRMDYWGGAGYYYAGMYYSLNPTGFIFKSPTLDFGCSDMVPLDDKEAKDVQKRLKEQDSNQSLLLGYLLKQAHSY
jgi:arylsulfatase A-like enzyme